MIKDIGNGKQYYETYNDSTGATKERLHRLDGPALDYDNGYRAWYAYGKLHRVDGAAVEFAGKECSYWLHGVRVNNIT